MHQVSETREAIFQMLAFPLKIEPFLLKLSVLRIISMRLLKRLMWKPDRLRRGLVSLAEVRSIWFLDQKVA